MDCKHECVIGLLCTSGGDLLVTVDDLKEHINRCKELNDWAKRVGCQPPYTTHSLKDYADKRRRTNLYQFEFCPDCGERIDWAKFRRAGDDG